MFWFLSLLFCEGRGKVLLYANERPGKRTERRFHEIWTFLSFWNNPLLLCRLGGQGALVGLGALFTVHTTLCLHRASVEGGSPLKPNPMTPPPPHTHTATSLGKGPCGLQSRDPWPPRGPASPQGERQEDNSPGTTNQERERVVLSAYRFSIANSAHSRALPLYCGGLQSGVFTA